MSNDTIKAYDVRMQIGRGRHTKHVAAISAAEARQIVEVFFPSWEVVGVRRSQYAIGAFERSQRREALETIRGSHS